MKPTIEEMEKRLKQWFLNFQNHPEGLKNDFNDEELIKFLGPHYEAYDAIRALIEKLAEWQEEAASMAQIMPHVGLFKAIRDFGKEES
jgi:hypothetical protein